ncbi:MAG: hypothetical protein ABIR47_06245 [Candidatus Kapaibacterium sp.]
MKRIIEQIQAWHLMPLIRRVILTAVIAGCLGCGSNDGDTLIAPTSEGKNILGCRVNQQVWNSTSSITPGYGTFGRFWKGQLIVFAVHEEVFGKGRDEVIQMNCDSITGTGRYVIDSAEFVDKMVDVTYTAPRGVHELTITALDTAKGIVAGTFSFNAGNASGDSVHITEGRFDFTY